MSERLAGWIALVLACLLIAYGVFGSTSTPEDPQNLCLGPVVSTVNPECGRP
jgi:hypothetical protein